MSVPHTRDFLLYQLPEFAVSNRRWRIRAPQQVASRERSLHSR
jgi:hypothetical protein